MIQPILGSQIQLLELAQRFEQIRDLLLTDRYASRLKNPLSHWVLPTDRRLPKGLLNRTLDDLLRTPFDSLSAVPGIGRRKMTSFIALLDRALHSDELERERLHTALRVAAVWTAVPTGQVAPCAPADDPAVISEVTWSQWRATIVDAGLGNEPLGRFVASLDELPRALWNVPVSFYAERTLAEIRRLKTHGEKRVRTVVALFGTLHSSLLENGPNGPSRIVPARMHELDAWLERTAAAGTLPTSEEIRTQLIAPLAEQIRLDAGEATAELVLGRVGWHGPKLSVRRSAVKLRLTRARIYQLLDDAAAVVGVRWPNGLQRMRSLTAHITPSSDTAEARLLQAAAEVFFPAEYHEPTVPAPAFLRPFPAATFSSAIG